MLNQADFIKKLAPYAQEDNRSTGVPACITLAQGALESGWGESSLTKNGNNLFGIKGVFTDSDGSKWYGNYPTKEQRSDGSWYTITAQFRHYPSWQYSVNDHSRVLLNAKFGNGQYRYRSIVGESDYKKAANILVSGGYATDQSYAKLLINIIEQYKLYDYNTFEEEEDMAKIEELEKELASVKATVAELKSLITNGVMKDPAGWVEPTMAKGLEVGAFTDPRGDNTWFRVITVLNNLGLLKKN